MDQKKRQFNQSVSLVRFLPHVAITDVINKNRKDTFVPGSDAKLDHDSIPDISNQRLLSRVHDRTLEKQGSN